MLEQRIQQHFIDSADLKYQSAQALSKPVEAAVQALLACVTSGGKVLACGNGASAAWRSSLQRCSSGVSSASGPSWPRWP
jgi:phosphoheptose isomerase